MLAEEIGEPPKTIDLTVRSCFDPGEYRRLPTPSSQRGEPGGRLYDLSRTSLLRLGEIIPGLLVRLPLGKERDTILVHIPTLREHLEILRKAELRSKEVPNAPA